MLSCAQDMEMRWSIQGDLGVTLTSVSWKGGGVSEARGKNTSTNVMVSARIKVGTTPNLQYTKEHTSEQDIFLD